MERKELREQILKASEGLIQSVTDLILHIIFYNLEVLEHPNANTVLNRAAWVAEKNLSEVNYQTIKRALQQLTSKGLVKKEKDKITITEAGEERLEKILPSFGKDLSLSKGEVYLVSYDIRETTRRGRDILRWWLRKIRAVMLQKSLFLVVSAIPEGLENLILKYGLEGEVLIIKLGKNSLIKGRPIDIFLKDIYHFDQLKENYQKFIKKFSNISKQSLTPMVLDFSFNRILKDDPNLPIEFLPKDWIGFKARALYTKLRNNIFMIRS
ncbi:hypothetical protein HY085_01585 [Candidatus Gottesmanbacteria bacterium]|nr:hypothetical protein [Candidatus Gottesmanbacteria bacterium]